jgi:alpha-mannosidase
VDDYRGVEEPLNETMCGCGDINAKPGHMGVKGHLGDGGCGCVGLAVKGRHLLVLDEIPKARELRRVLSRHINNPLQLTFFENDVIPEKRRQINGNVSSILKPNFILPDNIDLITLCSNYENGTLVRFAHDFQVGEHSSLSLPVKISLKSVFLNKIKSVAEYGLAANQPLSKIIDSQKSLPWNTNNNPQQEQLSKRMMMKNQQKDEDSLTWTHSLDTSDDDFVITIKPMDVVTLWIQFEQENK